MSIQGGTLVLVNYFFFAVFFVALAAGVVKGIKEKDVLGIICCLLMFPFYFYIVVSTLSGGRAIHDAKNDYELYQAGHYYLRNGSDWLEVTYRRYRLVLISEIVGLVSLQISFIAAFIHNRREKRKTPPTQTFWEKYGSQILDRI